VASRAHRAIWQPDELVSIVERMGSMRIVRVGFAIIVMGFGALAPRMLAEPLSTLSWVTGSYLLLLLVPEVARNLRRKNLLPVLAATLLLDGLYLGWVMYATGGAQSPLRFLVYIHVVAVTLLASYRTGLKIAAWHSLLFFVVFYAESASIIPVRETILSALPGRGGDFYLVSMLYVAGLWAVALGTAMFSAVIERELRNQKIDLEAHADMVAEIDRKESARAIPDVLLAKVCHVFGFRRGAVLTAPGDDIELAAYRGPDQGAQIPAGLDPVMERAWDHRTTVLVRGIDPSTDPRLAALFPDGHNLIIVPLFLDRGTRLGLLVLEHPGNRGYVKRWVVRMVEQFASHAALALHNAWLMDELAAKLEENKGLRADLMANNLALQVKVEERTQELRESLEELRQVDHQRRRLLSRLLNAEEDERRRIAGDIHDGPVQEMLALGMQLHHMGLTTPDRPMQDSLEAIRSGVDGAVEGLRDLVFDLRPVILDHAGLEPALRQYAGTLDGGLSAAVESRLKREVPSEAAIILYRIAQEALANVRKHAKASRVTILLDEREGGFLVQVQDNGIGFSPPTGLHSVPGHLGLSSMRERAEMAGGWCTVRSLPRGGTAVEAWVPATVGAAPVAQLSGRHQSMLVQNGGNGSQLADAKAS